MANFSSSFFRPKRGKKATAESQNIILKPGELFFEYPDTGVGTGSGKVKMGDGSTPYKDLPYFLDNTGSGSSSGGGSTVTVDVDDSIIEFTDDTSTDNTELLNKVVSGAKLKVIIAAIKKLLSNISTSISSLKTIVDSNTSKISTNTSNINSLQSTVSTNSGNISSNTSSINNLKSRVAVLEDGQNIGARYITIEYPPQSAKFDRSRGVLLDNNRIDNIFDLLNTELRKYVPSADIFMYSFMGAGYLLTGTNVFHQVTGYSLEHECIRGTTGSGNDPVYLVTVHPYEDDNDNASGSSYITHLNFLVSYIF